MVGEIFAGMTAVKTAFDMARGLQQIHDTTMREQAVFDLQRQILAAQEDQFALSARNRELEDEVRILKDWESEKQRYELVALAPNTVAFAEKRSVKNSRVAYYLCANCFEQRKKSYLQQMTRGDYFNQYKCNSCGEQLSIDSGTPPQPRMSPDENWM